MDKWKTLRKYDDNENQESWQHGRTNQYLELIDGHGLISTSTAYIMPNRVITNI